MQLPNNTHTTRDRNADLLEEELAQLHHQNTHVPARYTPPRTPSRLGRRTNALRRRTRRDDLSDITPARFSPRWVVASAMVFLLTELAISTWIQPLVVGKHISRAMWMRLDVVMILGAYFLGGGLIGLLSPRVRIWEPAAGAALASLSAWAVVLFAPGICGVRWKFALLGALLAAGVAAFGADRGERVAAALGNRASKKYVTE